MSTMIMCLPVLLFFDPIVEQPPEFSPWVYSATVVSVHDGDTVTLNIDLGFRVQTVQSIRLFQVDCPEVTGDEREAGIKVRNWVRRRIPAGKQIRLRSLKDRSGHYGRFIGELWIQESDGRWTNLNRQLIRTGRAEFYRE